MQFYVNLQADACTDRDWSPCPWGGNVQNRTEQSKTEQREEDREKKSRKADYIMGAYAAGSSSLMTMPAWKCMLCKCTLRPGERHMCGWELTRVDDTGLQGIHGL